MYPSCLEWCCSIHSPHVIKQLRAQLWYVVVPGAHKNDAKENGSTQKYYEVILERIKSVLRKQIHLSATHLCNTMWHFSFLAWENKSREKERERTTLWGTLKKQMNVNICPILGKCWTVNVHVISLLCKTWHYFM